MSIPDDMREEDLKRLRHTTSHVLAQAVRRLYPGTKLAVGPAIENGFYYDLDIPVPVSDDDLKNIETEMSKVIKEAHPLEHKVLTKEEASKMFQDEPYKLELISELGPEAPSVYSQGEFTDLCAGPHLENTKEVPAFKLLSVAGAYWRGDEKNKMLTRIYGTAFYTKDELKDHLAKLEKAKKRDHRKLGAELDLFTINDEFGAGLPLWHPKGAMLRKIIEDFWKDEHLKRGYELLLTPHIAKYQLWETSGHSSFYKENMYSPMQVEDQEFIAKPMNCPGHILIYRSKLRSYRELPLRFAELGTVYRYERSGVLHGLLRVRGFTQDDAHIFCREDQVEDEIIGVIEILRFMLAAFGFNEYEVFVSTRPEKSVGSDEHWELATTALKNALEKAGMEYKVDPGEGVFYGPKIDVKIKDALGRLWQCSTIQVDFQLPQRFGITYVDQENDEVQPIMVHRAILGSMERFIGCLIEHYGGAFPLWIAPVQVVVLPIADRHNEYARSVQAELNKSRFRAEVNDRADSVNKKIRNTIKQKVPVMLVVGDKEVEEGTVTLRRYGSEEQSSFTVHELINGLRVEIDASFTS